MAPRKSKSKKFKSWKTPRYLIGQETPGAIQADLKIYNRHRYQLFNTKAIVNCKPPKFNPTVYFNGNKLMSDAHRVRQIDAENKDLLRKINLIGRGNGSFSTRSDALGRNRSLKWDNHVKEMKRIEQQNRKFYYHFLLHTKSRYDRKAMEEFWQYSLKKIKCMSKLKLVNLEKDNPDDRLHLEPSICDFQTALRPRPVVCDGPTIGRIEAELYMDIVPVTVQNFLALCTGLNKNNLSYKSCNVHRIISGSHCETGDITRGNGRGGTSIFGPTFPEEKHVLSHTRAGVLSMIRVDANQNNNSQFCITFREKETLDRKYVVFGKVIKGMASLYKLEGYGSRYGKPLAPIIISKCGVKGTMTSVTIEIPREQAEAMNIKGDTIIDVVTNVPNANIDIKL